MNVTGCDIDPNVVASVNGGAAPFDEPGLTEAVRSAVEAGTLRATTDTTAAVAECNVVIVLVRVGIDEGRHADFSQLDAAALAIGQGLTPGTLVVLESTVPVGATRKRFGENLSRVSGLAEDAFQVAYSPERVSSGTVFRDLGTYPKLVGGTHQASGEAATAFYRSVLDAPVMLLPDAETAEFAKLAESVYRDVNIALANDLAKAAEGLGVDFAVAAKAANSQPYSHLHAPGLGVGGHCIPVYPYFLVETSDQQLVRVARQTNDSMAGHSVSRLDEALEGLAGKTVLILGLAYRGGVKEATLSSAILVANELRRHGAGVLVHDPLFTPAEIASYGLAASSFPPTTHVDAAILQALHEEYRSLDLASLKGCRVFFDGRGAFDSSRVKAAGMRYMAIGQPD
jgi:nucleotide sugar dehydrogenase